MIDVSFRSSALAWLPRCLRCVSFGGTSPSWRAIARALVAALIVIMIQGCAASPKNAQLTTPADVALDPASLQLVGRLSRVWGTQPQRVDGVSLVVGLSGTGSDPPSSAEREALLNEMQTREVDKPNSVLASSSTALVRVRALIPPGARKGDHFDLYVEVPRETDTTSIEGGWLMASRMREYAVVNNRVGEGHLLAIGQGDVLTDALLESGEDEVRKLRGRVLGGGVVTKTRGFGLVIRDEFTSVKTSSRIGDAINKRFNVYHRGSKQGVANPKRDNYIELLVHPRYVENEVRYIRVIQNIAVRESPRMRSARLGELRLAMADPSAAALAALQLEAIGEDGIPTLRDALDSTDMEIRFYAAEALAYQDVPDAVDVLDAAIRREPAFRWRALTALGAMDDVASHESLIDLLHVDSAETRYGAFRILRRRTPDDPMIEGSVVNDNFSLHKVSTLGPPLIHVSRIQRPEIVFFGTDHELARPVVLFAGSEIVVRDNQADGVTVSRLSAGDEDASVDCSRQVIDIVRGIAELDGTYADVVQALTEARRTGSLKSRLEFSAIPKTGRTYRRGTTESDLLETDLLNDELQEENRRDEQLPPMRRTPESIAPIDLAANDTIDRNDVSPEAADIPTNGKIDADIEIASDLEIDADLVIRPDAPTVATDENRIPGDDRASQRRSTRAPEHTSSGRSSAATNASNSVPSGRIPQRTVPPRAPQRSVLPQSVQSSTTLSPGTFSSTVPGTSLSRTALPQMTLPQMTLPSTTPPQTAIQRSVPPAVLPPNVAVASPDALPSTTPQPAVAVPAASSAVAVDSLSPLPSPFAISQQIAQDLNRAPKQEPPRVPKRLGASTIPQDEVAPLPPDLGPVMNFTDLIDPTTLPD